MTDDVSIFNLPGVEKPFHWSNCSSLTKRIGKGLPKDHDGMMDHDSQSRQEMPKPAATNRNTASSTFALVRFVAHGRERQRRSNADLVSTQKKSTHTRTPSGYCPWSHSPTIPIGNSQGHHSLSFSSSHLSAVKRSRHHCLTGPKISQNAV